MLSGILKVLLLGLGYLLIHLGYGREAMEARKRLGVSSGDGISAFVISVVVIFWAMCLLFLATGSAAKDTLWCTVCAIAAPVLYILWFIYARKSGKRFIEEDRKQQEKLAEEARSAAALREKERLEKSRREYEERQRLEAQRKEELRKSLHLNANSSGDLATFMTEAEKCKKAKDVLTLWESLQIEDSALSGEIGQRIAMAERTERIYGSHPDSVKKLIANIQELL